MRSASTLVSPRSYMEGYEIGKFDALNKNPRTNPFCDNSEKDDGYEDGFFDHYKGTYVEFQHSPESPIERRYFKNSSCAINFAQEIKDAQIRTK